MKLFLESGKMVEGMKAMVGERKRKGGLGKKKKNDERKRKLMG